MTLAGVKAGDIVLADRKGRRFYAIVVLGAALAPEPDHLAGLDPPVGDPAVDRFDLELTVAAIDGQVIQAVTSAA